MDPLRLSNLPLLSLQIPVQTEDATAAMKLAETTKQTIPIRLLMIPTDVVHAPTPILAIHLLGVLLDSMTKLRLRRLQQQLMSAPPRIPNPHIIDHHDVVEKKKIHRPAPFLQMTQSIFPKGLTRAVERKMMKRPKIPLLIFFRAF